MKDIISEREQLKKRIDNADMETLDMINDFFEFGKDDPLMNMAPEQQASFNRSLAQADNGELIPHEQVIEKYKKWFTP